MKHSPSDFQLDRPLSGVMFGTGWMNVGGEGGHAIEHGMQEVAWHE